MIKELGIRLLNIIRAITKVLIVIFGISTIITMFIYKNKITIITGIIVLILLFVLYNLCDNNFWQRVKERKRNK